MSEEIIHLIIRIICFAMPIALFLAFFKLIFKHTLLMSQKRRERLLKKAMDAGHVVTGRLVKVKRVTRSDPARRDDYVILRVATYEYEYKGKTYRSKLTKDLISWPEELTLYYVKNPKRATTSGNIGSTETGAWECFRNWFLFLTALEILSFLSK